MCSPPCLALLLGPTSAPQLLARCRSERSWFFAVPQRVVEIDE
ncbi:hypothetical protein pipiens_002044, partial [Culex pipiens pipiens]